MDKHRELQTYDAAELEVWGTHWGMSCKMWLIWRHITTALRVSNAISCNETMSDHLRCVYGYRIVSQTKQR